MILYEEIQRIFEGFLFGASCSEDEIRLAESALGEPLPEVLRELYCHFNGFLGPTGAVFFWPLRAGEWGDAGLVELNLFLRGGDEFPRDLMSHCIFFGDDGGDTYWGINKALPGQVIRWVATWGDHFEIAGENPLKVWVAEKKAYEGQ